MFVGTTFSSNRSDIRRSGNLTEGSKDSLDGRKRRRFEQKVAKEAKAGARYAMEGKADVLQHRGSRASLFPEKRPELSPGFQPRLQPWVQAIQGDVPLRGTIIRRAISDRNHWRASLHSRATFGAHFAGLRPFALRGADLVPFPYLDVRPALPACLAKQGASLTCQNVVSFDSCSL